MLTIAAVVVVNATVITTIITNHHRSPHTAYHYQQWLWRWVLMACDRLTFVFKKIKDILDNVLCSLFLDIWHFVQTQRITSFAL